MKREILFKGKDANGIWRFGFLDYGAAETAFFIHEVGDIAPTYSDPGGSIYSARYEVDYASVGQFTGMFDKNRKQIFEGDLIRVINKFGDEDEDYTTDSVYRVWLSSYDGVDLRFCRLYPDDITGLQYPISRSLNFSLGTLCKHYTEQKYDQFAVKEIWWESNSGFVHKRQNHYSADIEVVGNAFDCPALLQESENQLAQLK